MAALKCENLLKETGKEYRKINDAFVAFRSGEISGEELNKITNNALSRVDDLIESYGINQSANELTPQECYEFHRSIFERWEYGGIAESWTDEQGNLCIRYDSGIWFHYRRNGGELNLW